MNQYKKLMSNTAIFAIGTFSSKILVFLMTRFYTGVLTTSDYGIVDIIVQTCNVIIPIASLCIPQAVIRYGLERSESKHEVFSVGFFTILIGFVLILPFSPLIGLIKGISEYTLLIYVYVLTASMQSLCGQFVRARGHVKLYALDGIFRTVVMIALNFLFLAHFEWGIAGYVLSIICSDALSAITLFLIDNLYRYLHIRAFEPTMAKRMLQYAIPLIPTGLCVWVFSMSDRYFILYMIGETENGLYSLANKLPTILVLVSGIFIEAWQISTINDNNRKEQENFFSKVGNVYQSLVFMMASGIIMTAKLAVYILAGSPAYYDAWQFIPLLIFGTSFACLSNFQNSIYTLHKKTTYSFLTAIVGAVLNLTLNYLLIPPLGANGAALATLTSYIVMFLIRAVHTRKYLRVRWNIPRFTTTFLLLCLQSALMLRESSYWLIAQIALFLLITLIGAKEIITGIRKVLKKK